MKSAGQIYRFSVTYSRTRPDGSIVEGTTLVTSQRFNMGLPGAQERLKGRFPKCTVQALSVNPYMSGSDLVKAKRGAK